MMNKRRETDPQIVEAAFRIIKHLDLPPTELLKALEDILNSPSYDEKWNIIIEAFVAEASLKEIFWRTCWRGITVTRAEVIIYLEDKIIALKSRHQMCLRKYRQFVVYDENDAKNMMRRIVSIMSQVQRYEDDLRMIREGGAE